MKFGLIISLGLHAFAVGFGFLAFSGATKSFEDSRIIPIELVSLSSETNISAAIRKPKEKLPEAKEDEPMTLNTPMVNASDKADEISERQDKPVEDMKEAIAPQPSSQSTEQTDARPVQTAEVKRPEFDLDKLSGLIDKKRSTAPERNQQITLQSETNRYRFAEFARSGSGEGTAMNLSELEALQSAMYKCWRMPSDAQNPEKLVVTVDVKLLPGGFVEDVKLIQKMSNRSRDPGNPFWDVVEQRAIRAVSQCAPYDFLPDSKYAEWRNLTLNFAPRL